MKLLSLLVLFAINVLIYKKLPVKRSILKNIIALVAIPIGNFSLAILIRFLYQFLHNSSGHAFGRIFLEAIIFSTFYLFLCYFLAAIRHIIDRNPKLLQPSTIKLYHQSENILKILTIISISVVQIILINSYSTLSE